MIIQHSIYIYVFLILITGLLIVSHFKQMIKISNNLEILQVENYTLQYSKDPVSKIQSTLSLKQPTIFREVLFEWLPIAEIFDLPIEDINDLLKNSKPFITDLKQNLNDYGLPLTYNWNIKINEYPIHHKDTSFKQQTKHRHLICQITGQQRIYLATPNQKDFMMLDGKTKISTVDFWNKDATTKEPFNKIEFIEVILREGNILYIPYGWFYLGVMEMNDTLVMDTYCESVLNWIF